MMAQSWVLPEELRQLAESGDAEIVQEVLSVFQSDTAERLAAMRAASADGDRVAIGRQAHAVKGSSGQVGALALAEICRRLETSAAAASPAEVDDLISRIERELQSVCRQMQAE